MPTLHITLWIAVPLISLALGWFAWQAWRAHQALKSLLDDSAGIAAQFDGQVEQWVSSVKRDPRVIHALRDKTLLSINTPILYRAFDRWYLQRVSVPAVIIVGMAGAGLVFVGIWPGVLTLLAGAAGWFIPWRLWERRVRDDLAALAFSLALWHEYDAEICENAILMDPRFRPLLQYVKAHFPLRLGSPTK